VSTARSGGSHDQKMRIIEIVEELQTYWGAVPDKMRETRDTLREQLSKQDRT
jgi:hypothetical protein